MNQIASRRERKKQDTHHRLIQSARALFREKGFEETTVEEITERADVAKGTFFNYFPSKEALLADLALWGFERLLHEMDIRNGAPASPVARIKLLAHLIDEQLAEDLPFLRRAMRNRMFQIAPAGAEMRGRFSRLMFELVNEAQAKGEIRPDIDAEQVGELLHMFVVHQMMFCSKTGGASAAERFDRMVDFMLEGLAGPHWRIKWHR
jgi:AcrR family transcriptional regulator